MPLSHFSATLQSIRNSIRKQPYLHRVSDDEKIVPSAVFGLHKPNRLDAIGLLRWRTCKQIMPAAIGAPRASILQFEHVV